MYALKIKKKKKKKWNDEKEACYILIFVTSLTYIFAEILDRNLSYLKFVALHTGLGRIRKNLV